MTQVRTILGKVGFTPKGAWDAKKKYDRLDVVSQAGASFLSLSDENTALLTDATKWMVIASKGGKGDQGYTVQLKIGTVGSGDQPSVSLTDAGVDEQGNPVKEINFVLKRGKTGYTPIIEVGTVTTVDPKNEATIELIDNGLSEEGVQKYLLNASIPRGETGLPGKGAGNVYVIGDNLEVGKKYLFVPAASGSTEGSFIEYVPPTIPEHPSFSTRSSGLYKITVNNQGHVTDVAAVTKEDITALGIPAQDTDTVYTHPGFTARSSGLYKITVNNQGHVTDVAAVTKEDITALGIPGQDTNTVYTHPGFTARSSGLYKITVNNQGHVTGVTAVTKEDITALGIPAQDTNTTYTAATTQKDGLMSKTDKQKVDDSLRLKEYVDVSSLESLPASPYNLRFVYTNNSPQAINFANIASVPEMQEFYLSILNSSGSDFNQPIPNGSGWQSEESSVTLPSGRPIGISIKKEHGVMVVRC
ncbi:hypothetical protein [Parabacteroides goldsteinii]|uniref:hypothetical protein n=1 Tax=Parabacteroides goldsteinii TaxID=328812 RepID=UPI0025711453|nr:hypothetical protein [Parabacteroides goldsteinii]